MEYITKSIVSFLFHNRVIAEDDIPVYEYGAEAFIVYTVFTSAFVIIGHLSGQFLNSIVFIAITIWLRGCAGGYHADSRVNCYVMTLAIFAFTLYGNYYISTTTKQYLFIVFLIFSIVTLLVTAPTQNYTNPKTQDELRSSKKTLRFRLLVLSFSAIVLWKIDLGKSLYFTISETFMTVAIMSLLNLTKKANKGGNKNYTEIEET